MNIKLSYLYRDGGNYKKYNAVIFANPNSIPIESISKKVTDYLIDGIWFNANKWGLPDLHFTEYPWDNEIDHDWHEFESFQETLEEPTINCSIKDFLYNLDKKATQLEYHFYSKPLYPFYSYRFVPLWHQYFNNITQFGFE